MILLSACLAGLHVRYDGSHCLHPKLETLIHQKKAMTVCPELLGGFTVPRDACEIVGGDGTDVWNGTAKVLEKSGVDVTQQYMDGAYATLELAKQYGATMVVLKEDSPSCGSGMIYNGQFNGEKVVGKGVTAALLIMHGIQVQSEHTFLRQLV